MQFTICLTFVTLHYVLGLEPSLRDVTAIQCPPQRPYICLPYGMCCGGDEFCHQGSCESCFPRHIADHDLLNWCRDQGLYNVTVMRHNSCSLACYARFNTTVIPRPEEITFSSETTLVVCVSVLASLLILLVIGLIVCLVRRQHVRIKTHDEKPTTESPAAGNGHMITSTREDDIINIVNERRVRQLSQTDVDGQSLDSVQVEPLIDNTNV